MSKLIKLSAKANGLGYVTSYTVSLGCAEARACGFIASDGTINKIEKIVDAENHQVIIRLASDITKPPAPSH